MKNKMLSKAKKNLKKSKIKKSFMFEMAEDLIDVVKSAKLYKKITKK